MSTELAPEIVSMLETLRQTKRASLGQSLTEQDIMTFLVNAKDDRERTRLTEYFVRRNQSMECLADIFPEIFGFLKDWAKLCNIYFIPLDGQQRQEAILMTKAKSASQTTPLTIENIQNPVEPPQQQTQEPKKGGHFWSRGK